MVTFVSGIIGSRFSTLAMRVGAGLDVEPAEDQIGADRHLEAVRLELDALLLGTARARGHDRVQVVAHDGHAVDRDLVTILEALELDVMDAEPLLAVQEIGQALPEHGHLPGDRAIAGETRRNRWAA